jgi:hypothetical protein
MKHQIFGVFVAFVLCGCQSTPRRSAAVATTQGTDIALAWPTKNDVLKAVVVPPVGWKAEPLKASDKHKHQIWLSPSGNTAYGVIYFTMPWPVGQDLALVGFLNQMRRTEGQATLISKQTDDDLPGIRFVADGGLYTVRTNLIIDGFEGWAFYAGTIRGKPVDSAELATAEAAREQTHVQEK